MIRIRTTEEPLDCPDLTSRFPPGHKAYLVRNSPRGICLDDEGTEGWNDLGYIGDARRNRYAIEVRARNGRVVAAVAWNKKEPRRKTIWTLGTYVHIKHRRKGIGHALWVAMIAATGCTKIWSEPVSDSGLTLVNALKEKIKGVKICIIKGAEFLPDLVDLRKAGSR